MLKYQITNLHVIWYITFIQVNYMKNKPHKIRIKKLLHYLKKIKLRCLRQGLQIKLSKKTEQSMIVLS